MRTGAVITFRDNSERPCAEVALCSGDHVFLALDRGGLTISDVGAAGQPTVLFRGSAAVVSHLCAGLVASPGIVPATPLQILVAAVLQLRSPDDVRRAFEHAAAQVT
jgi:hypothetical protein